MIQEFEYLKPVKPFALIQFVSVSIKSLSVASILDVWHDDHIPVASLDFSKREVGMDNLHKSNKPTSSKPPKNKLSGAKSLRAVWKIF